MLLMDDNNLPHIVDDIMSPTPVNFFWVLDLKQMDYTLEKLDVLEEIICNTVTLEVMGFRFDVPANWNILVWSEETHEIDCVEASSLGGRDFTAFVFGPDNKSPLPAIVSAVDYKREGINVMPALGKHQMLCHPIGPKEWINVSSSDTYNKYLKKMITSDITG